ncbi:MAG: DHH family phosphoesterase [Methanomassiliicoccaceae archaeon]|jgi:RecJ-like exonuclease|nr:DHH family phosphoesterase [Methanomassiliicoccaceae archaeon]
MPENTAGYAQLERDAKRAASAIAGAKDVLVVAHIDADGICAAAIASRALDRLNKEHEITFVKKLDDDSVAAVNRSPASLVWLVDLGSGYLSMITRQNVVVADHHVPDQRWMTGQTSLFDFSGLVHVNPHNCRMDGAGEISGAGVTYVISKALDEKNVDLAYLAVVGASGDVQDQDGSGLVGYNRRILKDAVGNRDVEVVNDVRLFGRETRPLTQFLQYCKDPEIPGLTSDGAECSRFFASLNIELRRNGIWRTWTDLCDNEKDAVKISLIELLSAAGGTAERLMGEVYTLPGHEKGSELRDAKEFATLLNSCGRYDDAEIGMRICLGDREALNDAKRNRSEHKKQLSIAMSYIKQSNIIRQREYVQFFHARNEIRDTIVGIAASMVLGSGGVRNDIPIVAFANADDGVKVSARADKSLVIRGLDLSAAVRTAAEKVGGSGGGHNIAAGATIPAGREYDFIHIIEGIIETQIT